MAIGAICDDATDLDREGSALTSFIAGFHSPSLLVSVALPRIEVTN